MKADCLDRNQAPHPCAPNATPEVPIKMLSIIEERNNNVSAWNWRLENDGPTQPFLHLTEGVK